MGAYRVVNGADLPAIGWAVRAEATGPALQVLARKGDAVAAAQADLASAPGGGLLEVFLRSGRLEYRREVPVPRTLSSGPSELKVAFNEVRGQKKQADQVVEHVLGTVWPAILALPGGAVLAGLIAPAVAEQRTFFGVFLATLAWSAGIALGAALYKVGMFDEVRGGTQLSIIATVCLGSGALLAVAIGKGMYDVPLHFADYPGLLKPLAFIPAAIDTFGLLGAFLGAGSGVLAGLWAAKLYRAAEA